MHFYTKKENIKQMQSFMRPFMMELNLFSPEIMITLHQEKGNCFSFKANFLQQKKLFRDKKSKQFLFDYNFFDVQQTNLIRTYEYFNSTLF